MLVMIRESLYGSVLPLAASGTVEQRIRWGLRCFPAWRGGGRRFHPEAPDIAYGPRGEHDDDRTERFRA